MKPSEIEKINQFSLQLFGSKSPQNLFKNNIYPYFGYFNVDIFDCPDFTMFTNNDCLRSRQILFEKSFENTSMRIWCRPIKGATSTIDIGAHVGVYTLAAAASGVKNIYSFEPNPQAFERLRINLDINGFDWITFFRSAVSNESGYVKFGHVPKNSANISSGSRIGGYNHPENIEIIVEAVKFDDLAQQIEFGDRPIVKIDVEGSEKLVILRMIDFINVSKPDLILETFDKKNADDITMLLKKNNYEIYFIDEQKNEIIAVESILPANIESGNCNNFITQSSREKLIDVFSEEISIT